MASAADLLLKIRADIGDASKNITTLENQLKGFGAGAMGGTATLEQNLRKAQPAGIALAAVGGAITAGFAGAIATAADFEKSMSAIKSLMAPADIEKFGGALEKLALQLGKETAFTASAAASGIEELVKAGVPLEAILGGAAAAALDLAAATGIPVPEAAGFAATAMNAFKKNASELTGVMDTLAGVANASAADMTDLRFGFQAVGSVAPLVGMSFEDTATALGLFANNGLRGSDAGTSLKTMLMNLTPRTAKVAELMKELGIITADGANKFFDAKGKFIGLAGAADVLQAALKDMTPEEQMEALKKLFGSDAIRAGGILMREGAKGVNDLKAAIAGMTVADMAKTRLDNMKGSMEQLMGSLETAAIVIGTILIPPIRSLVDWGTRLLNKFLELPAPVQTAIIAVVGIAGAIMALLGGLILAGPFLMALPAAFAAIGAIAGVAGGAIAAIALPVLAIVAVLGVLYLAWTNNWLGIREIVGSVIDWFDSTALPAIQGFLGGIPGVLDRVQKEFEIFGENLNDTRGFFYGLGSAVQALIYDLFDIDVTTIGASIRTALSGLGASIGPALAGSLAGLGSIIAGGLSSAMTAAAGVWASTAGPAFAAIGGAFQTYIAAPIGTAVGAMVGAVSAGAAAVANAFTSILLPPLQAVAGFIGTSIIPLFLAVANVASAVMELAGRAIAGVWQKVLLPALQSVWSFLSNQVTSAFNTVSGAVTAAFNAASSAIAAVWNGVLLPAFQAVTSFVTGTLIPIFNTVSGAVIVAFNAASDNLATLWNTVLLPAFQAVTGFVTTILVPLFTSLTNIVIAGVNTATGALASVWTLVLLPAITAVSSLISGALSAAFGTLTNTVFPALVGVINGVVSTALSLLRGLGNDIAGAFNGISSAIQGVIRWLNDLANAIRNVQLPGWMTPGSPTPFELALLGIAGALRDVDRAWGMFEGGLPPATFNAVTAGAGAVGGPAGGTAATVTINGPIVGSITVAGEADEDRLVAKLHEMLVTGLSTALGQGTRFPAGVGVNR